MPPPQLVIPGGTGDTTTGCGSCRQKISQETFNMTTGVIIPEAPVLSGATPKYTVREQSNDKYKQVRLPKEKVKISKEKDQCCCSCKEDRPVLSGIKPKYTVREQSIVNYESQSAIDELYGGSNSLTPGFVPYDQQKSAIDELYSNKEGPPSSPKDPCKRRENYFLFDNVNLREQLFYGVKQGMEQDMGQFPGFFTKDCQLSLPYMPGRKDWFDPLYLDVDLSECCKTLLDEIWCLAAFDPAEQGRLDLLKEGIKEKYLEFKECVDWQVHEKLGQADFSQDQDNIDSIWSQILSQNDRFRGLIDEAMNHLFDRDYLIKEFTDFEGYRSDSCYCGEGKLPTFCCYPELHPELCLCPDGVTPRNLCSDEVEMDFILPYGHTIGHVDLPPGYYNCEGQLQEDEYDTTRRLIEITILDSNTAMEIKKYKPFKVFDLKKTIEIPNDGDISTWEHILLPIMIPSCGEIDVIFTLYFPCGACCKDMTQRWKQPTVFKLENFHYYRDYILASEDDKMKIRSLVFTQYVDEIVTDLTPEELDEYYAKHCIDC
ncbi:hypothetical protein ACFLSQ_09315 [Bacteroidota bacterium]